MDIQLVGWSMEARMIKKKDVEEYAGFGTHSLAREMGCWINSSNSDTIDSDTTFKNNLSQVLTISCKQTNKQRWYNLLKTNIIGIKGGAGSMKRRASGCMAEEGLFGRITR